ncbi:hypothetical protein CERZMDRAFT_80561 [Cercospora zeae-maydis SCOH1-5]|uniref:Adenylosuccinate lyase C-terminal domain-containing protein n=1 Tax=Cercospora zeae-maydis SCOH1-5 TaxID=717836 RepID=A0A6A6FXH6_9PEZI|nr:hypothetical protein CERZMDRAFT_80561 [Cercospora zeae-maydis SCOH1-5]
MITDFERATGPWHLEWAAVPESFILVVGALSQANFALSGLVINVDSMKRNLESTRGLIVAERVMMELARFVGRQRAHDVVYETCKAAIEGSEAKRTLFDELVERDEVGKVLSGEALRELCRPEGYLGAAGAQVDAVLGENANMGWASLEMGGWPQVINVQGHVHRTCEVSCLDAISVPPCDR